MISIPVRSRSNPPEWVIVELQGEIIKGRDSEPGNDFPVGIFSASTTKPGVVELQIGYHLLEGKIIALKKPLAVMERETNHRCPELPQKSEDGASSPQGGYQVIGIIRKKLLCNHRPRTLISNPAELGDKRLRVA
eukprot:jgi/Botrbrau1/3248/Bobra.174_1s0020.1